MDTFFQQQRPRTFPCAASHIQLSGQIGLSLPALPSDWLSDTVFKLFRLFSCGFSRDDGQIATEVPLAPNLLILCGYQSRCWLYLAKSFV